MRPVRMLHARSLNNGGIPEMFAKQRRMMMRIQSAVLLVGLSLFHALEAPAETDSMPWKALVVNPDGRAADTFRAEGRRGMAATASPEASRAAIEVLRTGGNAVDAAVAASFVVSVMRPQSTGLGGGGFALVLDPDDAAPRAYDFRERAPGRAHRDMYLDARGQPDREASLIGHRAVAVPGLVAGLAELHRQHGSRPWATLLEPAIRLAGEGFQVYPELARRLIARTDKIARNPAMAAIFMPGGQAPAAGELLVQTDLAGTLRTIARTGASAFYTGPLSEAIIRDQEQQGGWITREDLSAYRVKMHPPIRGTYREYEVFSMPPPSSGGIHLVQMLNILEGFKVDERPFGSAASVHGMTEAMRRAYADRAHFLGDPAFVRVPTDWLTSKSYAAELRAGIQSAQATKSSDLSHGTAPPAESTSTTHLCVVDERGMVVSSTQTINYLFGACVVAAGTGIVLNDEMDDFSMLPGVPNVFGLVGGEANAIAPYKTPLSSMTPTIVRKDGRPVLALGSPGGSRIITSVLQTVVNMIDHQQPLYEAVASKRFHHQWLPDTLFVEAGALPDQTLAQLRTMGHVIEDKDTTIGEVQAVAIGPDGQLTGVSDPRRSGAPAGW